jgi:hypothetical protein
MTYIGPRRPPFRRSTWPRSIITAGLAGAMALAIGACLPDGSLSDEGRRRPPGSGGTAAPGTMGPPAAMPADDGQPARFGPVALTLAVDCLRVQAQATRPVTARAVVDLGGAPQDFALGMGATLFDGAFRIDGTPGAAATARLLARDAEGMELQSDPIAFAVPAPAGSLVITEVLPNPVGNEARQEWVELANLGATPASLAGLRIEDAAGFDPLPDVTLAAGARALVVGANFDEAAPGDVPPAAGILILRVPGRIGRDGLGQAGEVIRVVDAAGLVRSSYGGWIDTSRAAWAGHSVQRQPDEAACDHPSSWSSAPLPATPGW